MRGACCQRVHVGGHVHTTLGVWGPHTGCAAEHRVSGCHARLLMSSSALTLLISDSPERMS